MNIPIGIIIIGSLGILFGMVFLFRFIRFLTFRSVEGTVLSSEVAKALASYANPSQGKMEISYIVKIKYEYPVDGRSYTSDRVYSLGNMLFQNQGSAERLLSRIVNAGHVRVFYDQAKPSFSFLKNGTIMLCWFPLVIGIVMICFGSFFYLRNH